VRKGIYYEETTSSTEMIWNQSVLPPALDYAPGVNTTQLVGGSVTSYNTDAIVNIFTDTVVIGAADCIDCPEPATFTLMGTALLALAGTMREAGRKSGAVG
jgi:hypothetical protein